MPWQNDLHVIQPRQDPEYVDRIINVEITKIRKHQILASTRQVHRDKHSLLWNVNLDQVIAVSRAVID